MKEMLILVNSLDEEIGYGEKEEVHIKGELHRAFSLFIYNKYDQKLLLQKRAKDKYHSGGLWTNSCCSHPRKGESLKESIKRRTHEELGIMNEESVIDWSKLREIGVFQYCYKFETCYENEIDHVFFLSVDNADIKLNPDIDEIEMVKWTTIQELTGWLEQIPYEFTVWFAEAFRLLRESIDI